MSSGYQHVNLQEKHLRSIVVWVICIGNLEYNRSNKATDVLTILVEGKDHEMTYETHIPDTIG